MARTLPGPSPATQHPPVTHPAPPWQEQACEQVGRGCHTGPHVWLSPRAGDSEPTPPLVSQETCGARGKGHKCGHHCHAGNPPVLHSLQGGKCKTCPFCSQLESFPSQRCATVSPEGRRSPPSPGNACGRLWPPPCTPACSHRCWG